MRESSRFAFLNMTKDGFCSYGLKGGPAMALAEFISELKEQKYEVSCLNGITCIKQFHPAVYVRNRRQRGEFISSILQASIEIARRLTNKEINVELQDILGVSTNIKQLKEANAFKGEDYDYLYKIVSTGMSNFITELWHLCVSIVGQKQFPRRTMLTLLDTALKGNHDILINIIVGLLKDRVTACDESESKRCCVQEKIKAAGIVICYSCDKLVYIGERKVYAGNYNHIGMEKHWVSSCTGNKFCDIDFDEVVKLRHLNVNLMKTLLYVVMNCGFQMTLEELNVLEK
ncbi:hypothetical protein Glove_490g52 [Diversispora epigaea]|uniref:Uncharacterized protein n=1 Tax=Diversispora epigaea TaxID=1348612 RepID=A0A397GN07_9GLOM|nr:hypothetical protein Glove_490g52 [Diversispora epigaea]